MLDELRLAALRETAGTLAQRARGAAHPRWRKLLADTWGLPRLSSPRRHGGVVWLVCPPGGELVQTWSFAPALRAALPDATLVLSTGGHAFFDVALEIRGPDVRLYTPWDLRGPVRRALALVRPDVVVAVEAAWQPVLLAEARRSGARTMLASGAMVADYHRAAPYARAMQHGVLEHLDLVAAKSEEDAAAFAVLGVSPDRIQVLGDLRADPGFYVVPPTERAALRRRLGLGERDRVLVAGSVHPGEDEVVLDAVDMLRASGEPVRLVLAPRYIAEAARIQASAQARGLTAARFTRDDVSSADVIVLDTYGDLPRAYAIASWVMLGGSIVKIGLGLGQNLVEPLAQGVPVFFGPHMRRWAGITSELAAIFPGIEVHNAIGLAEGIRELDPDGPVAASLRERASAYLAHGADSVSRHVEAVRALLHGESAAPAKAHRVSVATVAAQRLLNGRAPASRASVDIPRHSRAALAWIEANHVRGAGIRVHAGSAEVYPEVTGYLIPTLLAWGQHQRAIAMARWLVATQNRDGSWSDPAGLAPYTFDTGQILKGLLAVAPRLPEVDGAIRRGSEWLLTQIEPSGRVSTPDTSAWELPGGRMVDDRIHLNALQPLRAAARRFEEPRYDEAVERALKHYVDDPALTRFDTLSHFHAYVLEALLDLGYRDLAADAMEDVERLQRHDGSVPGYRDARWVCLVGLAQYAALWYRLGARRPADEALRYLCRRQRRSGGFHGSHGTGANYFPGSEISWAPKYFLDACALHVSTAFDADAAAFPEVIADTDGRVKAVLDGLGDLTGRRVLDAGCGKGRFARVVAARYPTAELWGVDVSETMLGHASSVMKTREGTLLDLPFEDASFDAVYAVESLEHAIDPETAVEELVRVLRPGGRLVIVDKNVARRGALRVEPWERWFDEAEVSAWLHRHCVGVGSAPIAHGDATEPDGLFLGWRGRRRP